MARRSTPRALHVALLALAACSQGAPGPGLDIDRAMTHVRALTDIGPRTQDSDGSRTAAGYIEDELDRIGLDVKRSPVGTVDLPAVRVLGQLYRSAHPVTTTDPNLLVRFGPSGKALLLMAHYDTVALSPGAADNASSVALLIELARELATHPPKQAVLIAFTANEEIGLVGAEALAAQRDDIAFAIALDLVGGDGPLVINGASELIGRSELRWLRDAAERAGSKLTAPPAHRVVSRWWPQAERSDHGPFTRRGVRAVHFYHRGNDGDWIDLAYHSPRDVPARLHRDALADLGRLLRALVDVPPPAHTGGGFWIPIANWVIPRWTLLLFEAALILVVIVALVLSRDGLVAHLATAGGPVLARIDDTGARRQRTPAPRGPALLLGATCYVAAVAFACVAERAFAGAHPAPWLHAPLRALIGDALVIGGAFGLATRAIARWKPWLGGQRYRAFAAIACGVPGMVLLVAGAGELAWIWLVPAAVIAVAPPRAALIAVVVSVLPTLCVLNPLQLREAAWNGFLPTALPLSLWLGILGAPTIATVAWWRRCRRTSGPLGTLVLGLGCGLAVVVGLLFAIVTEPTCTAPKFESFHLGCERV